MWRRAIVLSVLCLCAALLPLEQTATAQDNPGGLSTLFDMIVDPGTDTVFVAGNGGIYSFDYAGHFKTKIDTPDSSSPYGLAIDHGTLYASYIVDDIIEAYDTTTLALKQTYRTPDLGAFNIVFTAGHLWYLSDCVFADGSGSETHATLVALDPSTGVAMRVAGDTAPKSCGGIEASPTDPELLVVGTQSGGLYEYRINSTAPVPTVELLRQRQFPHTGTADFDFSPDGKNIVVTAEDSIKNLDTELNDQPGYASALHTQMVEFSPDGSRVAAYNHYRKRIEIYQRDDDSMEGVIPISSEAAPAGASWGGLAYSEDGARLFVFISDDDSANAHFLSLDARHYKTSLTLKVSDDNVRVGEPLTATARLSPGSTGAHRTVLFLARRPTRRKWIVAAKSKTDAHGIAHARIYPGEHIILRAVFRGDRDLEASRSLPVPVYVRALLRAKILGAVSHRGRYAVVRSNSDSAYVIVVIPPSETSVAVTIEVRKHGHWEYTASTTGFVSQRRPAFGIGLRGIPPGRYRFLAVGGYSDRAYDGEARPRFMMAI